MKKLFDVYDYSRDDQYFVYAETKEEAIKKVINTSGIGGYYLEAYDMEFENDVCKQ